MTTAAVPPRDSTNDATMSVAISGSSGLIGSALARSLESQGHRVLRIVRRDARGASEISWRPERGEIDAQRLDGVDVIVNLAGENLAQRWTDDVKRRIRESRMQTTTLIARTIAGLANKPRVLLSGSAIGIYGSRGDEVLDESSALGADFLASICKDWEGATANAVDAGVGVVHLRTGIVLSKDGGALEKMLLPFRFGVGGRLGSGRQWMSWIALSDIVRAMTFAMRADSVAGAVNLVSPNPVTNEQFSETLGRVMHRPSFFPVPRIALKFAFGEMADDTALASQRVKPARLTSAGFTFDFPELERALRSVLA
jgi:uncharacterized protein (TIGR01777 family)